MHKIIMTFFLLLIAPVFFGAGCFNKERPFISSDSAQSIVIPPSSEGAKASTGGFQATVTPSLDTKILVRALPDDEMNRAFKTTIAQEKKNPVPMQDGTRTEFTTVSKIFTKEADGQTISVQTSLTDTRSIPVLTAFIQSYSEFANDQSIRKKIPAANETAWLTYSKELSTDSNGFGSVTMLYRNRFLIQIDGNLGITEAQLVEFLNGYHFDLLQ